MIKEIGIKARKDIENVLDKKVYLELFVKVVEKWRDKDKFLNAVFSKEIAKIDLLEFIGLDKMSYVEYWNSRNGYAILPSL